jgi:hypothetical protein
MNKIQILFFDNLKHIFNSYNSFIQIVEEESKRKLSDIEANRKSQMNPDLIKLKKLEDETVNRKDSIIKELELSLDKYMKNLPESPLVLPIKVKIFVEKKNIIIDHVNLMPTDPISKLYDILNNYFTSIGKKNKII